MANVGDRMVYVRKDRIKGGWRYTMKNVDTGERYETIVRDSENVATVEDVLRVTKHDLLVMVDR